MKIRGSMNKNVRAQVSGGRQIINMTNAICIMRAVEKKEVACVVVACTFNPSVWGGRGRISEFKVTLVYRASLRATQINPVSTLLLKKKGKKER